MEAGERFAPDAGGAGRGRVGWIDGSGNASRKEH